MKIRESQQGKCIKNKTTRTFEHRREAWRVLVLQRYEDSSKPAIFLGRNFNFISLWDEEEEQRKEILHLFSTFHSPFVETLVSLKDEEGEE